MLRVQKKTLDGSKEKKVLKNNSLLYKKNNPTIKTWGYQKKYKTSVKKSIYIKKGKKS